MHRTASVRKWIVVFSAFSTMAACAAQDLDSGEVGEVGGEASQDVTCGIDLVVSSASLDGGSLVLGERDAFTVSDTVANNGCVDTGAASITTYLLSKDGRVRAPGTSPLGTHATSELTADAGETTSAAPMAIPPVTPNDTYEVLACADRPNVIAETNEANNCYVLADSITVSAPDLISTIIQAPTSVQPGGSLRAVETTQNIGTADASATHTTYVLTDVAATKYTLKNRSVVALAAGASSNLINYLTVPSTVPKGPATLTTCSDAGHAVLEASELNNCDSVAVNIGVPDYVATDVLVDTTTVSQSTGSVNVTYTIGDIADGDFHTTNAKIYISTNPFWDSSALPLRPLCDTSSSVRVIPALDAGGESSVAMNTLLCYGNGFSTPAVPVDPGRYYILACANFDNLVHELGTPQPPTLYGTNNCAASEQITVTP